MGSTRSEKKNFKISENQHTLVKNGNIMLMIGVVKTKEFCNNFSFQFL